MNPLLIKWVVGGAAALLTLGVVIGMAIQQAKEAEQPVAAQPHRDDEDDEEEYHDSTDAFHIRNNEYELRQRHRTSTLDQPASPLQTETLLQHDRMTLEQERRRMEHERLQLARERAEFEQLRASVSPPSSDTGYQSLVGAVVPHERPASPSLSSVSTQVEGSIEELDGWTDVGDSEV